MKGMGNMMKQAQKLQTQMLKLQEEMAARSLPTASSKSYPSRSKKR
jgi:DNA-binding protein YbaB